MNDNDTLPFVTIAACTRNVLKYLKLHKEKTENSDDETKRRNERECYIEQRAAEIRRFEERASGIVPNTPRRKGKPDY